MNGQSEMDEKKEITFLTKFKKYHPEGERLRLLASSRWVNMRYKQEPLRVEVELDFDERVSAELLYAIEAELRELYGALSFRIFPHMPPECFSCACMGEIAEEAMRVGAVIPGFFYEAVYHDDGEKITCAIPYLTPGVGIVNDSGTAKILENILRSRYGISRRVEIVSCEDAEARTEARLLRHAEEYERITREAAERSAAERREKQEADEKAREAELAAQPTRVASLVADARLAVERDGSLYRIGSTVYDFAGAEIVSGLPFEPIDVRPLVSLPDSASDVIFFGTLFAIDSHANRAGDRVTYTLSISDGTSSVQMKKSGSPEEVGWLGKIKEGTALAVRARIMRDRFDNEPIASPKSVMKIKCLPRMDDAEEKRVELHLHTVMSSMDGLIRPADIVATAERFGHPAVAITDHGNVQSFPEVMLAKKKTGAKVKILYGIECYYVNDTARAVYGPAEPEMSDEMVVFDIETTGLDRRASGITEIGAVKIRAGEIIDRFQSFVNPGMPIPENIVKLTRITDDMVKDAPPIETVLREFLAFTGDSVLIAHNANFDTGFLRVAAERAGIPFTNTYLDTLALSRYVNSELTKHTLDSVAKHYGLGEFGHHRADEDAEMLARVFFVMQERLRGEGILNFRQMNEAMSESADPLKLKPMHMVIFAKNLTGLKNLYKLISKSYLDTYRRVPRMPRSVIEQHREGLIIGSACEAGELYRAILDNQSDSVIEEIASFYDYLEIQPLSNNTFLIADGQVKDEEALREINRRIIALGKKLGKPVCATCDAHFLNKEDEIYRKILLKGMKFSDGDKDTFLYYRTTNEMLSEFAYLGEETAREVVITNPRKIADMIEDILPIPDGTYTPALPGAEQELTQLCWDRAHDWYGDPLPEIVESRLSRELDSIIKNGFAVLYMIAQKLVAYSESLGYLVGSRGSVGSSFVASMSGISEVNPLPPHYRCLKCKHSEFITDGSYGSGFDLPDKACPVCGEMLYADGHDIPFETFLGFKGDKSPDIDLNFSGDVQGKVHKYTEELFGEGNVFRAGTMGTLASKTAYGYVMKYLEEKGISLPKAEVNRLVAGCVGVKRTTGQHPGGIIVVPKEYDIHDFTPVQHPADDPNSDIVTTHFPFSYLHDTILKLDELGHDMPTKYKMLERYTNTSVLDVKMNDKAVYELFASTRPLGISPEDIGGCQLGTYGLPEMGTHFIQSVLLDAKPKNFADLLQISGLTHGTDVWLGNAQDLIKEGICDISKVIGTRDGIMLDLIRYGLDNSSSFKIMESVRKGKGLTPEWEADMLAHGVPEWYIASCKKIKYMFPKAHAAAYVMSAIRLGWYKIHYPMEFYAAFLTVAPGGFDAETVMKGRAHVNDTIAEIQKKGNEATQKESEMATTLQLVGECMARGIRFLPVDLLKSDAAAFLPENGSIRMPFNSLAGLGDTAAAKIVEVRGQGEIYSVEDLRERARLSRAVIDILRRNGVLDSLTETNQFSFF